MNRFFHYVYILIKPIICLLFPNEIVGANRAIEGIEIVDNAYYPVWEWTLPQ